MTIMPTRMHTSWIFTTYKAHRLIPRQVTHQSPALNAMVGPMPKPLNVALIPLRPIGVSIHKITGLIG